MGDADISHAYVHKSLLYDTAGLSTYYYPLLRATIRSEYICMYS